MKHYTVMDIGGTFIKYGVMNEDFQEVFLEETPTEKLPEPFLAQIIGVTEKCSEYAANNGLTICGIAISMAGFINPVTGENTDFTVSERFRKYNLKKVLNEKTSLPVSVENDSNCAALAEIAIGAGVGCEDVCMMTIGTGIGGAIIHGGKLLRGRNFKAGEFGLTYIGREIVNGKAVYRAPTATSVFVRNASRVLGFEVNGKTVFGYMDNPEVKALYDTWVDDIAMTVGGISYSLDPEKFLIGGGISKESKFIDDVRNRAYEIFPHLDEFTKIEACKTGNNAGKVGALTVFFDEYGK